MDFSSVNIPGIRKLSTIIIQLDLTALHSIMALMCLFFINARTLLIFFYEINNKQNK